MHPYSSRPDNHKTPGHPIRLLITLTLIVSAAVLLAHWPVLSVRAISFDDQFTIRDNTLLQNPGSESVRQFFSEVFRSSVVPGYYRPLTLTSLMLDRAMAAGPDDFLPFHRTSLALHVGSTVLLILLCWQLFGNPWAAALVGLLFGVHPLAVEPIAWLMERKTLLAAFFSLACLCAYVLFTRRNRRPWYALALFLYLLALLSKPTSTPLPLIILLISYWPLRRLNRRAVLEIIPFLALSAVFAALTVICEQQVNPLSLPATTSPLHLPLRFCYLIAFYLAKILLPIHLSSTYMLPDPLTLSNPIVVLAVVTTAALAAALIVSRRWTPAFWVGSLICLVGLAPTMGFVGYSWVVASDKYLYLPAVGLLLSLSWLLDRIWSTAGPHNRVRRLALVAAVALAASLLGLATRSYLRQWATTEQLNRYMLDLAPNSPELNYGQGLLLRQQNRLDEAIARFQKAAELKPDYASAHYGMGRVLFDRGQTDRAITEYELALKYNPLLAKAHTGLYMAYLMKNQLDQALEHARKLIDLLPQNDHGYQMAADVLLRQNNPDQATTLYEQALRLEPANLQALIGLGDALIRQGKPDLAAERLRQAVAALPDPAAAHLELADLLIQRSRIAESLQHHAQAYRLKPTYQVMNELAWTLATHNLPAPPDIPDPVQLAEKACQLTGHDDPNFLDTLAAAYARTGRFADAVRTADQAHRLAASRNLDSLAARIQSRRQLYLAGRPYDETLAATAPAPLMLQDDPAEP